MKRHLRHHDEARARDAELARLTAFAFHSPKKIPEFKPMSAPAKPKREVSTEIEIERGRAYLIGLATRST